MQLVPAKEYAYTWGIYSNRLYWANDWVNKAIRSTSLPNGGAVSDLDTNTANFRALANDPARVFLFSRRTDGNAIYSKALPGGTTKSIAVTTKSSAALVADSIYAYFGDEVSAGTWALRKVPHSGGTVTTLASKIPTTSMGSLAVDKLGVYFRLGTSGIVRVALPNGIGAALPPAFAATSADVIALVSDGTKLYWTDRGNGSIGSCPVALCKTPVAIATGQGKVWGITEDADAVYWVTEEGFVRKIAK